MNSIRTNPFAHLRFSLEQVNIDRAVRDSELGVGIHEQAYSKQPDMIMLFYFPHIMTDMWAVGYTAYIGNLTLRISASAENGLFRSRASAKTWALGEILMLYNIETEKNPKARVEGFKEELISLIEEARQYIINF